jgi:hypothetical protein
MQKVQVSCPECGQLLSAPAGHTGRIGCRACKRKFGIVDGEVEDQQTSHVISTAAEGVLKSFRVFSKAINILFTIAVGAGFILIVVGGLTSNLFVILLGGLLAVGTLKVWNPWLNFL